MALSPFHGIFSALGQATEESLDLPVPEPAAPSPPPVSLRPQQVGQIAVDIYEYQNHYIVRAPIAGVRLADLDIEVDGKVLTIRGTRRPAEEIAGDQFYLQECFWGEFSRSITLPTAIDARRVKATFSKDCILKVIVPKEERIKIVRINEG